MDPPASYYLYPGTGREANDLAQVQQVTPPGAVDDSVPSLVSDHPHWYAAPPPAVAETEPASKRRKLRPSTPPGASPAQIGPYLPEVYQLASQISPLPCHALGRNTCYFQQLALASLPMDPDSQSLSWAGLGRLVCPCSIQAPQETDGYERLIDNQPHYDPNQQYVAEKTSLAPPTDCDKNPEEPDGICLTCKKVTFAKTGQLPCLRYKIADVALYKSGEVPGFEWTRRWSNELSDPIDTWASPEIRTIRVSEGYSDNFVELQVRRFVPMDGDKLVRTWDYKGEKKSASIPPFALVDTQKAKQAFARHIDACINDTLKKITASIRGPSVKMMTRTYFEAHRLAQKRDIPQDVSNILQSTFRLWTSTRLNTISCFIVGDDTLGMPKDILDETSPTPGKVPVPPVMGAQLNLMMIHEIQARLRKTVLDQLQKIVQKNKHSTWLVTYFVDFILLHNASMIIAHDAGYAKKHGIGRRFAREDKVKEYHVGANIVLAYFHYCNKGLYPFSDECSESELRGLAELTEHELSLVRATSAYAKFRGKSFDTIQKLKTDLYEEVDWQRLRESEEYDHPEYYISQMFEPNWKPRAMVV